MKCETAGFGIIHWTTKPLDLYFKSLVNQVWAASKNQPLDVTCRQMAAHLVGPEQAEAFGRLSAGVGHDDAEDRTRDVGFLHRPRTEGSGGRRGSPAHDGCTCWTRWIGRSSVRAAASGSTISPDWNSTYSTSIARRMRSTAPRSSIAPATSRRPARPWLPVDRRKSLSDLQSFRSTAV